MSDEQKIEEKKDDSEQDTQNEFEKDLELLEKKNQEYLAGWQRAKADYLNLKKESEKKYQDLIKFANAGLIMEILPVLDNFKLAIAHIPEDQRGLDWVIGIMHIKKQLEDFLKNLGIEEIKTVGEKFNPEFHEAVEDSQRLNVQSEKLEEGKDEKEEKERREDLPAQADVDKTQNEREEVGEGKDGEEGKIPLPPFTKGGTMEGKEAETGIIVKELRAGYTMHGKVIQAAKVVVE